MSAVTEAEWRNLVAAYEAAVAASDAALEVAEAGGPSIAGSVEEAACDRCWAASVAAEDRLLGVVAPSLEGVAYQLRVFAERFHQVDLAQRTGGGGDRMAGKILRRIHAGITLSSASPVAR